MAKSRKRARDAGLKIGHLASGPLGAITDVKGLAVGHCTLREGQRLNTGVTAILPHAGDVFRLRPPAGFWSGNGFGKFVGSTQIEELGEIETPILLTNTLSTPECAAALIEWTLARASDARSVNSVVGETNDGILNDIRARAITSAHAREALECAQGGGVPEGAVGAGAGVIAFGWKGGIGTASRVAETPAGAFTIGVLVQTNYGGRLTIAGAQIGKKMPPPPMIVRPGTGSAIVIVATDAPLSDRSLTRVARRALFGLARTGSIMAHGSGEYALAFSTHPDALRDQQAPPQVLRPDIHGEAITPIFDAVVEAVEESVVNALFMAETVSGDRATAFAIDIDRVAELVSASS